MNFVSQKSQPMKKFIKFYIHHLTSFELVTRAEKVALSSKMGEKITPLAKFPEFIFLHCIKFLGENVKYVSGHLTISFLVNFYVQCGNFHAKNSVLDMKINQKALEQYNVDVEIFVNKKQLF